MSEKIELTKEIVAKATDYIPIAEKEAWTESVAQKCFDRLSITAGDEAMPPMYKVNTGVKSRYLMAAFVKRYLGLDYASDERDEALMSESDYDKWAGGHALNQIERFKRDESLRDKCFDMLSDYHDLEKRLSAQIMGFLSVQNDFVVRQSAYTAAQMKDFPAVLEQLKELQGGKKDDGESAAE